MLLPQTAGRGVGEVVEAEVTPPVTVVPWEDVAADVDAESVEADAVDTDVDAESEDADEVVAKEEMAAVVEESVEDE